jgi:hypothetical protein
MMRSGESLLRPFGAIRSESGRPRPRKSWEIGAVQFQDGDLRFQDQRSRWGGNAWVTLTKRTIWLLLMKG